VFVKVVVQNTRIPPPSRLDEERMLYFIQQFWIIAGIEMEMLYFVQDSIKFAELSTYNR
jgi:hypothetical protein